MTKPSDQDHDSDFDSRFSGGDVLEQQQHPVAAAGDVAISALAKEVAKVLMNASSLPNHGSAPGSDIQTGTELSLDGSEKAALKPLPRRVAGINNQGSVGELGAISLESHSTAPPLYRS